MAQNNGIIETNLAGIPASARKAFLTRAFGSEDFTAKASVLRRENPARAII